MADGYFVGINWNNDGGETGGDFSDVGEDVTDDVLQRGPVTFQYGRDQARALSPPRVGSIGFRLCNTSGIYSPENPDSPIAADVAPGSQIKVTETIGGTEYPLMRGRIDMFKMSTQRRDRSVEITGLDDLSLLRGNKITMPVYQAARTGLLIVAILDEVGWVGPRDIDAGATFVPYFWANNEDAFDLVTKLLRAEGPPAVAYVSPDGSFVFRDRHHRFLYPQSLTSQGIFEVEDIDCGSPPVTGIPYIDPFEYEIGWRDIVNDVRIEVTERTPDPGFTTVWESDATLSLSTNETVPVSIQTQEPFMDAQTPTVAAGDFVYTGAGTPTVITMSETSGQATTVTVRAVGGPVNISYMRLRARSIPVARTVQVLETDSTSIAKHGDRTYPDDIPYVSQEDAEAVAQIILSRYAERRPTVSMRLVSNNLTTHLQEITRTISDLITIKNPQIRLDENFFIENIQHTLARMVSDDTCPGPMHYATFGCEQADTAAAGNPFTFDKVGAGFDDGVFGANIADDPTTLFIFDHPTQGQFDVGRFAT